MKSQELATSVGEIVKEAQARITGIGATQYAMGDMQKFESMTMDDLLIYMEEELLDQINYSVMNLLRLRWLREALKVIAHESVSPANLALLERKSYAITKALQGKPRPEAEAVSRD